MFWRNVLFWAVAAAGLGSLSAALYPDKVLHLARAASDAGAAVPDTSLVVGPLDSAFHRQWQLEKLAPAGPAPEWAVVRRLSLALVGTVPSLEQIRRLETVPEGQRVSRLLGELFQDRRFGDYFAERLARAFVGTEDGPFLLFRRRRFVSWLSEQVMANRSYRDLVRELISAEGVWTDHPAANFITATIDGTNDNRPNPERLAARVSKVFLGFRLDCARCHNHPFDHWKQRDFQGLAAYFGGLDQGLTGIHDSRHDYEFEVRKTGKRERIEPCVPFLAEVLRSDAPPRQQLADWVTHPDNPYFARATANRVWALLFGRPLVEPVDNLPTDGRFPPALDVLAEDFRQSGYDLRHLIRTIVSCEVFRLDSVADREITEAHEKAWAVFPLTGLRPDQVIRSIEQAASLETLGPQNHILSRVVRAGRENDFLRRYGDTGEDEFEPRAGTIPQRLLMMNGGGIKEVTEENLFNAATRLALLSPDDATAVTVAYLAGLTRKPTSEEAAHFESRLAGKTEADRKRVLEDLYWALLNSTEFSWNH